LYTQDTTLPYVDVEVKSVILDDLQQSPYSARIEFDKVYVNANDHTEMKREKWVASVTYVFRETVKNEQLAVNPQKSRLYAIMHRGGVETHKDPGKDVWVFDVSTRQRVQQFALKNLATSIQLSSDAQPLLYSISLDRTDLDIYDAASGKLLRSVEHVGTTPTVMVTP